VENRTEKAENERDAKSTLVSFYKEFVRGSKIGRNGFGIGVHNFFLGALEPKPRACGVSLRSLAMGNLP